MNIPSTFRQAIMRTFYDKEIVLLPCVEHQTPGFGKRRLPVDESPIVVRGNWHDSTDAAELKTYGLSPVKGAVFTCADLPLEIVPEWFARSPSGTLYRIRDVLRRDSHCKVICEGVS